MKKVIISEKANRLECLNKALEEYKKHPKDELVLTGDPDEDEFAATVGTTIAAIEKEIAKEEALLTRKNRIQKLKNIIEKSGFRKDMTFFYTECANSLVVCFKVYLGERLVISHMGDVEIIRKAPDYVPLWTVEFPLSDNIIDIKSKIAALKSDKRLWD